MRARAKDGWLLIVAACTATLSHPLKRRNAPARLEATSVCPFLDRAIKDNKHRKGQAMKEQLKEDMVTLHRTGYGRSLPDTTVQQL